MGYIKHHAIVVTGYDMTEMNKLYESCKEIINIAFKEDVFAKDEWMGMMTDIVESKTNGYFTFVITPDGSKEGWQTSDCGDKARVGIIQLIESRAHGYFNYAELFYGEDNGESRVTKHN